MTTLRKTARAAGAAGLAAAALAVTAFTVPAMAAPAGASSDTAPQGRGTRRPSARWTRR